MKGLKSSKVGKAGVESDEHSAEGVDGERIDDESNTDEYKNIGYLIDEDIGDDCVLLQREKDKDVGFNCN